MGEIYCDWIIFSLVFSGTNKGIIKGVADLAEGKATLEEGFDTVAGQTMLAAGGAIGAKSFAEANGKLAPAVKGYRKICKRSIIESSNNGILFHNDYLDLPENFAQLIPKSFSVRNMLSLFARSREDYSLCNGNFQFYL